MENLYTPFEASVNDGTGAANIGHYLTPNLTVSLFSTEPRVPTPIPLLHNKKGPDGICFVNGGEEGIRTLGTGEGTLP